MVILWPQRIMEGNRVCRSEHRDENCNSHTSVSIANGGCQFSGGMILQIPYFLPSGAILRMYSKGSLNSSSVGRNVGASCKPWGRIRLLGSRGALGCPRRSTVDRSRGADLRALKGTL